MGISATLGLLSGAIQLISVYPYVKSIVRGTTRPNAVSYAVWVALSIIEVYAAYMGGAGWPLLFPAILTFNMTIILGFALTSRYGYRSYSWIDGVCLVVGLFGVYLWYATSDPRLAIILATLASLIGAIPTFVKTYKHPETEYAPAWLLMAFAGVLSILSTSVYDIVNIAYPAYVVFETSLIAALALGFKFRQSVR